MEEGMQARSEERDLLLSKYYVQRDMGGVRRFEGLGADILSTLIAKGYADPEDRQNEGPPIKEFLEFMLKYPQYKAHGYAVSFSRTDHRVSIEGLECKVKGLNASSEAAMAFLLKFRNADELQPGYCWYD